MNDQYTRECVRAVEELIKRVRVAKVCPPALAKAIAELNAACAQEGVR